MDQMHDKLIGWWFLDVEGCYFFVLYTNKCIPKEGFYLVGCAMNLNEEVFACGSKVKGYVL